MAEHVATAVELPRSRSCFLPPRAWLVMKSVSGNLFDRPAAVLQSKPVLPLLIHGRPEPTNLAAECCAQLWRRAVHAAAGNHS
jgi:hypothetical protein